MAETSRQRAPLPQPILEALDTRLEGEKLVLEAFLKAAARLPVEEEAWDKLHAASKRDGRNAELAFAYESFREDKRLRALPPPSQADFLLHGAIFFGEIFGDDQGAATFLERALVVVPGHPEAFEKLEALLLDRGDLRALAERYVELGQHRPSRAEQAQAYRRAVEILASVASGDDRLVEVLQFLLRVEPHDEAARFQLAAALSQRGRPKDVVRVLEQGLTVTEPAPSPEAATRMRLALVELYADELREVERATPHVEALLALDPANAKGRAVAEQLLESKGVAARAAAALAAAHALAGAPEDVARYLSVELEHTRGTKRREVLLKLGVLRQDRLGDAAGAYEVLEQALVLDPTDDETRQRYVALAMLLGRQLDAVKTLGKVATTAKDAPVRARLSADTGELLLSGGDKKRAKTVFSSVLAMPEAPDDAVLRAAHALHPLLEEDGDAEALAEILERVVTLEPDPEKARAANERVAEVATGLGDRERATAAWKRLLPTTSRARALENLEAIYREAQSEGDLAFILEERAKDAPDDEARTLLMSAAEASTRVDPARAVSAFQALLARFGTDREVNAKLLPLLEAQNRFLELAVLLEDDATLAPANERGAILARAGLVRLARLREIPQAISLLSQALKYDRSASAAQTALEKLLSSGDHRLAAAVALEPFYRAVESQAGLLRVLELKAKEATSTDDRLAALDEAVRVAQSDEELAVRALDFAGLGLAEAALSGAPFESWIDRVISLSREGDAQRRAAIFVRALGDGAVEGSARLLLARHTGDALASVGDVQSALAAYRRALAFDPSSRDLVGRVDALLRDQGNPRERVALYTAALERETNPEERRPLYHQIGKTLRHELHDLEEAAEAYRQVLAIDADDRDAHAALVEIYTEVSAFGDLIELLEKRLARSSGADATKLRAELAELCAGQGDGERASTHAAQLLEAQDTGTAELDVVERAANLIEDWDLLGEALERRAHLAGDPKDAIAALERLGLLRKQRQDDDDEAVSAYRRAARLAEESGDGEVARRLYERIRKLRPKDIDATSRLVELLDKAQMWTALPELIGVLAAAAETAEVRADLLVRLAAVLADHLGDPSRGAEAAASALRATPTSRRALDTFERLSILANQSGAFGRVIDELMDAAKAASFGTEMTLARARVFARDPKLHDEASEAYREILTRSDLTEEQRTEARSGFDRLLETAELTVSRRADARWLLRYQAEHSDGAERVEALLAWARAEESTVGDVESALAVYRQVLEADPDRTEAAMAVTRLTLATGDVEGAIASLFAQRERAEGAARRGVDIEIATILVDRGERLGEALGCLEALLADAPDDIDAVTLVTRLLRVKDVATRALELLENARTRATDAPAKQKILMALLEGSKDGATAAVRRTWHEELAGILRATGKREAALSSLMRAVEEEPSDPKLWDACEELARELKEPGGVAAVYMRILGTAESDRGPSDRCSPAELMEIAERAVAFHEEWFDDPAPVVAILSRVLEVDPETTWAFDRLKLLYDSREQWDDLFALYDQAIATTTTKERKVELLDEAAQTAKDFANHSSRAIDYLEQLHELKPTARVASALERLYERHGRHQELIDLLVSQLPTLAPREGREARIRVANLAIGALSSPGDALAILEEVLAPDPKDSPSLASLGDVSSKDRVRVVELLERVIETAQRTAETRPSMLPPPPVTEPPPGAEPRVASAPSIPPPRARIKRVPVRQRAAAILRAHYVETGDDARLAGVLEVELEVVKSVKERIRRHAHLASLYLRLSRPDAALEHFVALVMLEPDVREHRDELSRLAEEVGRFDRLAEVLAAAADDCTEEGLRVELLMQAGLVHEERLGDTTRTIELYMRILAIKGAGREAEHLAARRVEPLLRAIGRTAERLDVLERVAALSEDDTECAWALAEAALLAESLGDADRSARAWEKRLEKAPADALALDGLVALFERQERWSDLADALRRRASIGDDAALQRADRVRLARLRSDRLDDAEGAIEEWRAIEQDFGPSDDSTHALVRLLRATAQWERLSALLDVAAERATTPQLRATMLRELGDVKRSELQDAAAAIRAYEAALLANPTEALATLGLVALADALEHRPEALRVLLAAYAWADDWQATLKLTEHRLEAAPDDARRVMILVESAQIAEQRARDLTLAIEHVRRAFALAPADRELEAQLFRLTERTDSWREYAEVHRRAIDATGGDEARDPVLSARLRLRLGEALEKHLDDSRGALAAYLKAAAEAPDNIDACLAAVRLGGASHRYDAVARVVLQHAAATGAIAESLLATLESVATSPAAWDGMTSAFGAALAEPTTLSPAILRDFESRVGAWHRDRRGDPDAAEAAFARALSHDAMNAELLSSLASIQRRAKGRPLVESLLRLSQATGGDLELLREAAEIATSAIADRALAKSILERLAKLAIERWELDAPTDTVIDGTIPGSEYLKWALEELIRIHNEEGDPEKIVELLVDMAKLPFERDLRRSMRHRAARVAVERIGDVDRAIKLYEQLYGEDTSDLDAERSLVELLTSSERKEELLLLRRRQVALAAGTEARLELRLLAARLELLLGRVDDATATLHENLKEDPRHGETVAELVGILESTARSEELASLLAEQAALAEAESDAESARLLWSQAARVAEERLGDLDAAIRYHSRVVALFPEATSLEALARLSSSRGDHAAEAEHLAQLLECTLPSEQTPVILRLGHALERAGRAAAARDVLERAVLSDPSRHEVRARLAVVYREANEPLLLARLLRDGAAHAATKEAKQSLLHEAATLFRGACHQPEEAIPLLTEAASLEPEDRALRLSLADTLGEAGRAIEARTLLRGIVEEFGGRRPKERAPVHLHLARLDLVTGDREHALAELEAANRIDPANPEILLALAELARDDGELERAERSYRALLAVVRRDTPGKGVVITKSEVLLELSEIARRQGEAERSAEILESALEAGSASASESTRLELALRARAMTEVLARAIEARLLRIDDGEGRARALFELADALATLGRHDEAYGAALRGLELDPSSDASHAALLLLARKTGGVTRYVEMLSRLARSAEDAGDAARAHDLLVRLAVIAEDDRRDLDEATSLLERARALRESTTVLQALERVYKRRGDREPRENVVLRWLELERAEDPSSSRVADVLVRLAELRFAAEETSADACALAEEATRIDPEPTRLLAVAALLAQASEAHAANEPILAALEDVARRSKNDGVLLDALQRKVRSAGGDEALREAVTLAERLGEADVATGLLQSYVRSVRKEGGDKPHAAWALVSLALDVERRGDLSGALSLRLEAAQHSSDTDGRRLRFDVAKRAEAELANLTLAAEVYRALYDADTTDRAAWGPLLDLLRRTGADVDRGELLAQVIPQLDDVAERCALRLERAALLFRSDPRSDEGIAELFLVLDDDPESAEAARLLSDLLRSQGRGKELAELLTRQLDGAKDKENGPRVAELSLELASLVEGSDADRAAELLRGGLEWQPENPHLLRRLLSLLEFGGDAAERSDLMERLLRGETGRAAEELALKLIALREEAWDEGGVERAAALGYKGYPASQVLRARLVAYYAEKQEHAKLADLYVLDASSRGDATERVDLLKAAASLFLDSLAQPERAAQLLKEVRGLAPGDEDVFANYVAALTASGNYQSAAAEVTAAAAHLPEHDPRRAALFAKRASLRALLGDHGGALYDIERAYATDPATHLDPLCAQLDRLAEEARGENDTAKATTLSLRVVSLFAKADREAEARARLTTLLAAQPGNKDALRALAELEERGARWPEATTAYLELAAAEESPESMANFAIRAATAAENAGDAAKARPAVERAFAANPTSEPLMDRLRAIYQAAGAITELAGLGFAKAQAALNPEDRFRELVRAADLLLQNGIDLEVAGRALHEAHGLKPNDVECAALLSDAYAALGEREHAMTVIHATLALHKGRRARELSLLHHRVARLEQEGGNARGAMMWLSSALDLDGQNGLAAAELAHVSLELGDLDLATKALRAVTMLKTPGPLPRALAYQRLGEIAHHQGDTRKAVLLLKRAVDDDPTLDSAKQLLSDLQAH